LCIGKFAAHRDIPRRQDPSGWLEANVPPAGYPGRRLASAGTSPASDQRQTQLVIPGQLERTPDPRRPHPTVHAPSYSDEGCKSDPRRPVVQRCLSPRPETIVWPGRQPLLSSCRAANPAPMGVPFINSGRRAPKPSLSNSRLWAISCATVRPIFRGSSRPACRRRSRVEREVQVLLGLVP